MRGDDLALPTVEVRELDAGVSLPMRVGGNEISWSQPRILQNSKRAPDRIEAISIVLEAYGILETLDDQRRAELISDILSVFEDEV